VVVADPAVVQVAADAEAGRRREFCPEAEAVEVAAGGGRRKHSCKKNGRSEECNLCKC
jgi:hypothetical protein